MIMEGLNRYGSRDERIQQRIAEVVGSYATTFIRELENCVCCQAVFYSFGLSVYRNH